MLAIKKEIYDPFKNVKYSFHIITAIEIDYINNICNYQIGSWLDEEAFRKEQPLLELRGFGTVAPAQIENPYKFCLKHLVSGVFPPLDGAEVISIEDLDTSTNVLEGV